MSVTIADRFICAGIILFGIAFALLGGAAILGSFWDPYAADASAVVVIGCAAIGYGWRCVRGFKQQRNNGDSGGD
jgi:hypothetical protein